jgi:hypothetical protein
MRHDALGSAVELRRNGLVKRGDLRDLHDVCSDPFSRAEHINVPRRFQFLSWMEIL